MPKKLSFEDFEEEIEGPKEKKVEKKEKVKAAKGKKVEKAKPTAAPAVTKPAPSKPAPAPSKSPIVKPAVISPSAYFKTAAASKRHSWTWAEFGKKATCAHAGCKASMNWTSGKRGGIIHFYLIEGDSSPRDRVPGCPCARVEGKTAVAGKAKK